MFTELMPLLKQRAVMITISDVGEGLLRVNIIPRKIEGGSEDNAALTTPLSITGKAEACGSGTSVKGVVAVGLGLGDASASTRNGSASTRLGSPPRFRHPVGERHRRKKGPGEPEPFSFKLRSAHILMRASMKALNGGDAPKPGP